MVFAGDDDYRYYPATVREWKKTLGCKVYSFCLMTNHVHLVIDPGETPGRLGLFMKRAAARQTRLVNRLERRYREWLLATVPPGEWDLIRKVVQRNQLTGGNCFTEKIEKKIGLRIELRGPGRLKKRKEKEKL